MRASAHQDDCDRRVLEIFCSDLAHHVLWVIAVYEVFVVKGAESFGGENFLRGGPMIYERIHLVPVSVKRRDENVPFLAALLALELDALTKHSIQVESDRIPYVYL